MNKRHQWRSVTAAIRNMKCENSAAGKRHRREIMKIAKMKNKPAGAKLASAANMKV
jgi:hypothetical protein